MIGAHFEEGRGGDKSGPANESLTPDAAMRQAGVFDVLGADRYAVGRALSDIARVLAISPIPYRMPDRAHAILERVRDLAELVKRAKEHECETFPRESCEHLSAANIVSDLAALDLAMPDDAGARPATADEHEEAIQAWRDRFFAHYDDDHGEIPKWMWDVAEEGLALMRSDRGPGDRVPGLHFCSYSKETGTLHVHFKDVSGAMRVRVNDRLTQIRNGDDVVGFVAFRLHEPFSNAPWDAEQSMVDLVKAVTSVFDSGWLELAPDQVAGREAAIARDYNWMLRALVQLNEAVHAPEKSDATDAERRVHNMEDGSVDGPPSAEDVAEQAEATEAELRDQLESAKSAETAVEAASDALREAGILPFDTLAAGVRALLDDLRSLAELLLEDDRGQAIAELETVAALASVGDWFGIEQNVKERLAVLRSDGKAMRPDDLKRTDAYDCTAILRQLLREVRDRIERFGRLDGKNLIWVTYVNVEAMLLRAIAEVARQSTAELQQRERPAPNPIGEPTRPPELGKGWRAVEEPEQPEHDGGGEPSMVQCNFDDPDVVPRIVGALDGLDSRVRKLEQAQASNGVRMSDVELHTKIIGGRSR